MKRLLLVVLILWPIVSYAQESNYLAPTYDQELDYGIRIGWGKSTFSNYKNSELADAYDFLSWGWGAGAFLQLRVNHIYFQPEILFIKSYIALSGPDPDDNTVDGDLSLDFSNLQIPLVVGYRLKVGKNYLRAGAGLYLNILMSSQGEFILTPGGTTALTNDDLAAFNDLSVGWRFNAGFDIGTFLFDAHFQAGFSRDEEFVTYLGADLGNASNWGFTLGYKIFRKSL